MPRSGPIWLALIVLLLLLVQPGPSLAAPQECPAEMVAIPAGRFRIGAAGQLDGERATGGLRLSPFCLAAHEVTNRQFAAFVAATGYRTVAERPLSVEQFPELKARERAPGSLVFQPVAAGGPIEELSWWHWVPGAYWRRPQGPASTALPSGFFRDALSAITAAVVGVIASLAVFFAGPVLWSAAGPDQAGLGVLKLISAPAAAGSGRSPAPAHPH